jgi:anti-sigma factor RsiW
LNPELFDATAHQLAAEQIPWYVNGSLEAAAASRLAAHLEECTQCRGDYQAQVRLYEAMQADGTLVFAAEPSFQKLMGRIGDGADARALLGGPMPAAPPLRMPTKRRATFRVAQWLAAAVVVEALGLGYGAWAWHAHTVTAAPYVTLTSAEPSYHSSPRIRVVFRSGLSVQGLGSLLRQAGAHIIDGPTAANVYTLGFADAAITPGVVERRAAALRANDDVLFAEPQDAREDAVGNAGR